jgi:hypothetical protein
LWAPAWAGLLALANQGRVAAGEATLNSSTPTDTQQALYMLPQSDYNMIATGNNGYTAGAGYNLATGLGTPVASTLVPDLVAYHGPGTSYSGPTIAALRNVNLVNSGTSSGSPIDVFSVFDSFTVPDSGLGMAQHPGLSSDLSVRYQTTAPGLPGWAPATGSFSQSGHAFGPGFASNLSAPGLVPRPVAGVTGTQVSVKLMPRQPAWSGARPWASLGSQSASEPSVVRPGIGTDEEPIRLPAQLRAGLPPVPDSVLDELAADTVLWRVLGEAGPIDVSVLPPAGVADVPSTTDPLTEPDGPEEPGGVLARLAVALLAAGSWGYRARILDVRNRPAGRA